MAPACMRRKTGRVNSKGVSIGGSHTCRPAISALMVLLSNGIAALKKRLVGPAPFPGRFLLACVSPPLARGMATRNEAKRKSDLFFLRLCPMPLAAWLRIDPTVRLHVMSLLLLQDTPLSRILAQIRFSCLASFARNYVTGWLAGWLPDCYCHFRLAFLACLLSLRHRRLVGCIVHRLALAVSVCVASNYDNNWNRDN